MKLKKWEIALAVALAVTLLSGFALDGQQHTLSDKMIRLHVVANSDTEADQDLKLTVRDRILEEIAVILEGATEKSDAENRIAESLAQITAAAQEEVYAQGYTYTVTASIAQEDFPTREYETFSLPAGEYTSLRVKIGAAAGQNWWCVLFPPLCTSTALEGDTAVMQLTEEEKSLITMDGTEYVIKFKSIEVLERIKTFFKNL